MQQSVFKAIIKQTIHQYLKQTYQSVFAIHDSPLYFEISDDRHVPTIIDNFRLH